MAGLWTVQQSRDIHPMFGQVLKHVGLVGALLSLGLLVLCSLLLLNRGKGQSSLGWVFAIGFLASYSLASIAAAERVEAQVPLSCHKTELNGEFRLLDQSLRQGEKINWIFEPTAPHPCIDDSARLSMNLADLGPVKQSIQVGDVFKATVVLRALHAPLQLQGFDVHRHWMSRGISGLAIAKNTPTLAVAAMGWNPVHVFSRARNNIRVWLQDALQDNPQLPLIMAMTIGDQGLIDW